MWTGEEGNSAREIPLRYPLPGNGYVLRSEKIKENDQSPLYTDGRNFFICWNYLAPSGIYLIVFMPGFYDITFSAAIIFAERSPANDIRIHTLKLLEKPHIKLVTHDIPSRDLIPSDISTSTCSSKNKKIV
jgi:hypothetical protein